MSNSQWIEHAYPLQQIRVELQGSRHSDAAAIIDQLETVLARLRAGDVAGSNHDDGFGYRFTLDGRSASPSFFGEPAATTDYDPPLSEAGFMDLVTAMERLLKTDASRKSVEDMPDQQRDAAMRVGDAAAHYRSIAEPR